MGVSTVRQPGVNTGLPLHDDPGKTAPYTQLLGSMIAAPVLFVSVTAIGWPIGATGGDTVASTPEDPQGI